MLQAQSSPTLLDVIGRTQSLGHGSSVSSLVQAQTSPMTLDVTGRTQSPVHGCSSSPLLQAQSSPKLLNGGGNPGLCTSRGNCERGAENSLPL
eukprot:50370-Pyramimonas_sp.AAC.1